jgi:hypothetical protein
MRDWEINVSKADQLWYATHADFKAVIDGKRYVMRTIDGVTRLVPVEEMVA